MNIFGFAICTEYGVIVFIYFSCVNDQHVMVGWYFINFVLFCLLAYLPLSAIHTTHYR